MLRSIGHRDPRGLAGQKGFFETIGVFPPFIGRFADAFEDFLVGIGLIGAMAIAIPFTLVIGTVLVVPIALAATGDSSRALGTLGTLLAGEWAGVEIGLHFLGHGAIRLGSSLTVGVIPLPGAIHAPPRRF